MKFKSATIALIIIILSSCKKESDPAPSTGNTSTTLTDVCNSGGTGPYWPIKIGNKWNLVLGVWGEIAINIKKDTVINNKTYLQLESISGFGVQYAYTRVDPSGTIFSFDSDSLEKGSFAEEVDLPADIQVGKTWIDLDNETHKIVSLSGTITTPLCTYNNLLQIDIFKQSESTPHQREFYKKGVGPVATQCLSNCFGTELIYLKSMSLKP
jgi:hypothetical protein